MSSRNYYDTIQPSYEWSFSPLVNLFLLLLRDFVFFLVYILCSTYESSLLQNNLFSPMEIIHCLSTVRVLLVPVVDLEK